MTHARFEGALALLLIEEHTFVPVEGSPGLRACQRNARPG